MKFYKLVEFTHRTGLRKSGKFDIVKDTKGFYQPYDTTTDVFGCVHYFNIS